MRFARTLRAVLLTLPLLAAGGAECAEVTAGNRLVPGGGASLGDPAAPRPLMGETRIPLATMGGLSLGALSDSTAKAAPLPFAGARGALAVGGYVAYGSGSTRLSSSLKSDGTSSAADISAASLLGADSTAALSLGVSKSNATRFSPNAQQLGASFTDPYRPASDINMSLSLIHQVTPAFSVGGVAAASRQDATGSGLTLGAGLGYRF